MHGAVTETAGVWSGRGSAPTTGGTAGLPECFACSVCDDVWARPGHDARGAWRDGALIRRSDQPSRTPRPVPSAGARRDPGVDSGTH